MLRSAMTALVFCMALLPAIGGEAAPSGLDFNGQIIDKGWARLRILNWNFFFTCSNTRWGCKGGRCICELANGLPSSASAGQRGVPNLATPLGGLDHVDGVSWDFLHVTDDAVPGGSLGGGCGSCGGNGGSVPDGCQAPSLPLTRSIRPRDSTIPSSFGPGTFSNYDILLTVHDTGGGERVIDVFDPQVKGGHRFVDGPYYHPANVSADVRDGRYVNFLTNTAKGITLFSSAGQVTADPLQAKKAVLDGHDGAKFTFELVDLSAAAAVPVQGMQVRLDLTEGSGTVAGNGVANSAFQGQITGATWTSGVNGGQALSFDGADDSLQVPGFRGVGGTAARTCSVWINTTMADGPILDYGNDGAGTRWWLGLVNGGAEGVRLRLDVGGAFVQGESHLADGRWHHVSVVVPDGAHHLGDVRLYVDGLPERLSQMQQGVFATNASTGRELSIGVDAEGRRYRGLLGAVRLQSAALSTEEVLALSGGTRQLTGRLTRIEDHRGLGVDVAYRFNLGDDLGGSPSKLMQRSTVTDGHGDKLVFHYAEEQKAGHWLVDQITLPNQKTISYEYDSLGFLSGVVHQDGSRSSFAWSYDAETQSTVLTWDDAGSPGGMRRGTAYFSSQVGVIPDTGDSLPQAVGLTKMVLNGEDEVVFLNIPDPQYTRAYIYEGGGKLKWIEYGMQVKYATSWSIPKDQPVNYYNVQFTGEPTNWKGDFSSANGYAAWYREEAYRMTDPAGRPHDITYNAAGRITRITYPDGTSEDTTYNAISQPIRTKDRSGKVTKQVYDSRGLLIERQVGIAEVNGSDVLLPEYAVTRFGYGAATDPHPALLMYAEDPRGNRTDFGYDSRHFPTTTTQPADVAGGPRAVTTRVFGPGGRVESTSDPTGRVVTYGYDARDRVIRTTYADNSTQTTTYGAVGSGREHVPVRTKDRNGNLSDYEVDQADRQTLSRTGHLKIGANGQEVSLPADGVLESHTTYLVGTRLVATQTAGRQFAGLTYDYRNRVVASTAESATGQAFTSRTSLVNNEPAISTDPFDRKTYLVRRTSDGAVVRVVRGLVPNDGVGSVAQAAVMARPTTENPSYAMVDYSLDSDGDVLAETDESGRVHRRNLDGLGRPVGQVEAEGCAPSRQSAQRYDLAGNVVEVRGPRYFDPTDATGYQKTAVGFTWNGRNRLASAALITSNPELAGTVSVAYTIDGLPTQTTDAAGRTWLTVYRRCCQRVLLRLAPPESDGTRSGVLTLQDFEGNETYRATVSGIRDLDGDGVITWRETDWRNLPVAQVHGQITTRYDARHRPVAQTIWKEYRPSLDTQTPPIAGDGGIPASAGLTTRWRYDENLCDQVGIESNLGTTLASLPLAVRERASAVSITNPAGETSVNVVDGLGRLVLTVNGAGEVARMEPGDAPAADGLIPMSITMDPAGLALRSTTWNDGSGRVRRSQDAGGSGATAFYDAQGRIVRSLDALGRSSRMSYDSLGRPSQAVDAGNQTSSWTWNLADQPLSHTSPRGGRVTFTYDERGRRVSATDVLNQTSTYVYDAVDQLLSVMDPQGGKTSFEYDQRGRRTAVSHPGHNPAAAVGTSGYDRESFTYDQAGRLASRQAPDGLTTTNRYDRAGLLVQREYSNGSAADQYTYDQVGRLLTATSGRYANTVGRSYDAAGRVIEETADLDGQHYVTSHGYDQIGRRTWTRHPDGRLEERVYSRSEFFGLGSDSGWQNGDDGSSQAGSVVQAIRFANQVVASFQFDANWQERQRTYGNGVVENRTWTADGQMESVKAAGILDLQFGYNADGSLIRQTDGVKPETGFTQDFDLAGRLLDHSRQGADASGRLPTRQQWNLDAAGEWVSTTRDGVVENRTFDSAHRLTSRNGQAITHDQRGNLLADPTTARRYAWNENDLLASVSDLSGTILATYRYDALGRRIQRTDANGATTQLYSGDQVVERRRTGGAVEAQVYGSYIDEPLLLDAPAGKRYYHHDHRASVYALSDEQGGQAETYRYDAYGRVSAYGPTGQTVTPSQSYLYTGREADPAVPGLYDFRNRAYSAELGRFLNRDPLGFVDGWSLYSGYFAMQGGVDPWGLDTQAQCFEKCLKAFNGKIPGYRAFCAQNCKADPDFMKKMEENAQNSGGKVTVSMAAWTNGETCQKTESVRIVLPVPQPDVPKAKPRPRKGLTLHEEPDVAVVFRYDQIPNGLVVLVNEFGAQFADMGDFVSQVGNWSWTGGFFGGEWEAVTDFGGSVRAEAAPHENELKKETGTGRETAQYAIGVTDGINIAKGAEKGAVTAINWFSKSNKTFGHAILLHGRGAKITRSLKDRARTQKKPQGQWLDNDKAAEWIKNNYIPDGVVVAPIPEGLGQVIMPDGKIVPATHARIVPRADGVITTAFPVILSCPTP